MTFEKIANGQAAMRSRASLCAGMRMVLLSHVVPRDVEHEGGDEFGYENVITTDFASVERRLMVVLERWMKRKTTGGVTLKRIFIVLLSATVLSATPVGQTGSRGSLEGVWKVAEVVVTGANPSNTSNPQPGLFIFARTHYSMMRVPGNQPRALYQAEDPTDAEKIAAFDSFVANTGTYEIAGTTLTIRPMIARNPNFAAGGFQKYQFRIEGNTLWLTEKSTDLNFRLGERVVASAPPANETRMKLTRVE